MGSQEASKPKDFQFSVEEGPLPDLGKNLLERDIPSDLALVTPAVIRAAECLREESLCSADQENRVCLCIEEALRNAVVHGNGSDFSKKVQLRVFSSASEWGFVVSDAGKGFDPTTLKSPIQADGIWAESGRGLFLISHYMDSVTFYGGGSTVVAVRSL